MSFFRCSLASLFIGLAVLIMDFASKYYVHYYLPLARKIAASAYSYEIPVFSNFLGIQFSISHVTNRGAAWGMFSDFQFPLLILRLMMIGALLIYLIFYNPRKSWQIPLAMIVAGALGNVLDYFLYGHVVDMLHAVLWGYDFPVFNVADSAISIGVFWLLIASLLEKKGHVAL